MVSSIAQRYAASRAASQSYRDKLKVSRAKRSFRGAVSSSGVETAKAQEGVVVGEVKAAPPAVGDVIVDQPSVKVSKEVHVYPGKSGVSSKSFDVVKTDYSGQIRIPVSAGFAGKVQELVREQDYNRAVGENRARLLRKSPGERADELIEKVNTPVVPQRKPQKKAFTMGEFIDVAEERVSHGLRFPEVQKKVKAGFERIGAFDQGNLPQVPGSAGTFGHLPEFAYGMIAENLEHPITGTATNVLAGFGGGFIFKGFGGAGTFFLGKTGGKIATKVVGSVLSGAYAGGVIARVSLSDRPVEEAGRIFGGEVLPFSAGMMIFNEAKIFGSPKEVLVFAAKKSLRYEEVNLKYRPLKAVDYESAYNVRSGTGSEGVIVSRFSPKRGVNSRLIPQRFSPDRFADKSFDYYAESLKPFQSKKVVRQESVWARFRSDVNVFDQKWRVQQSSFAFPERLTVSQIKAANLPSEWRIFREKITPELVYRRNIASIWAEKDMGVSVRGKFDLVPVPGRFGLNDLKALNLRQPVVKSGQNVGQIQIFESDKRIIGGEGIEFLQKVRPPEIKVDEDYARWIEGVNAPGGVKVGRGEGTDRIFGGINWDEEKVEDKFKVGGFNLWGTDLGGIGRDDIGFEYYPVNVPEIGIDLIPAEVSIVGVDSSHKVDFRPDVIPKIDVDVGLISVVDVPAVRPPKPPVDVIIEDPPIIPEPGLPLLPFKRRKYLVEGNLFDVKLVSLKKMYSPSLAGVSLNIRAGSASRLLAESGLTLRPVL